MLSLNGLYVLGAAAIGVVTGVLLTWAAYKLREARLERAALLSRLAELECQVAELSKPRRQLLEQVRLDERQRSLNVDTKTRIALTSLLDAMQEQSMPMLVDALRESGVLDTLRMLLRTGLLK